MNRLSLILAFAAMVSCDTDDDAKIDACGRAKEKYIEARRYSESVKGTAEYEQAKEATLRALDAFNQACN